MELNFGQYTMINHVDNDNNENNNQSLLNLMNIPTNTDEEREELEQFLLYDSSEANEGSGVKKWINDLLKCNPQQIVRLKSLAMNKLLLMKQKQQYVPYIYIYYSSIHIIHIL